MKPIVTFSIVSHAHGKMLLDLLIDLSNLTFPENFDYNIIVTFNINEKFIFPSHLKGIPITYINNLLPRGFGSNHNTAFSFANPNIFIVLNPDIRINNFDLLYLLNKISNPSIGILSPKIISPLGNIEDSARKFPTIFKIFKRRILNIRGDDYLLANNDLRVDWVAGIFLVIKSVDFISVNGFNEKYFMYLEDADICKRIGSKGLMVIWDPKLVVTHDARRATFSNFNHLKWHIRSLFRFLFRL